MFSVDRLTKIYGDRILFQNVTLHFNARRRYGLVGANGAGKTTFLKIVKGKEEATDGSVNIPKEVRIGLLDQNVAPYQDIPLLDLVMMGDRELWEALKEKERLLARPELMDEEMEQLSSIESLLNIKGGYRAEAEAAQLLSGLGFETGRQREPLRNFSGGFQLRVLLAQVLFIKPEVLLLDEPTNYLDILSIRFLERLLIDYPGTLILSSHDRVFLNKVCQEIIDIDYGEMRRYVGNFDHFLEEKRESVIAKEAQLKSIGKRKKEIERFIERFKAKASKARQAGSRERMIEKLEEEEKGFLILPSSRLYPRFNFSIPRPSGQRVILAKEISKRFGEKEVLSKVSFEIEKGEKVALVGPNGVGKSTLLEILTGCLEGDAGSACFGPHTHWVYFPQNYRRLLSEEMTVCDWIMGRCKEAREQDIREALGAMLFDDQGIRKKIKALSGGEAARLVFAFLMLENHNVFLLDEPTNHLDMESVDTLIAAIKAYQGTLLMVSHNRYFISETATRILELSPMGITNFLGGYEAFVEAHERDYLNNPTPFKQKKENREGERKERNQLKREIERLEREVEAVEKEIHEMNLTLSTPNFYEKIPPKELEEFLYEKDRLEKKREEALNLWEEKLEQFETNYK